MFIYDSTDHAALSISLNDDDTAARLVATPGDGEPRATMIDLSAEDLRGLATEALAMADEIDCRDIAAEVQAAATTEDAAELADPGRFCRTCGLYHSAREAEAAAQLGRCPRWAPEDAQPEPEVMPLGDWTVAEYIDSSSGVQPEYGDLSTRSYQRRITGQGTLAPRFGWLGYMELAELRMSTVGELPAGPIPHAEPSGATAAVSAHAADHVTKFRRQWGHGPTAQLAVGLTRQQQAPRPEYPACDELWAYHAMATLRSMGRQS